MIIFLFKITYGQDLLNHSIVINLSFSRSHMDMIISFHCDIFLYKITYEQDSLNHSAVIYPIQGHLWTRFIKSFHSDIIFYTRSPVDKISSNHSMVISLNPFICCTISTTISRSCCAYKNNYE